MLEKGVAWATLRCRSSAFLKASAPTHPTLPSPTQRSPFQQKHLFTRTREGLGWSHQPSDFLLVLGDGAKMWRFGQKLLPQ